MASSNKSKDKKSPEQQRRVPEQGSAGDFHKPKPSNGKRKAKANKLQKCGGGWSVLGKVNLLLLVVVAGLTGRVLYLHSAAGADLEGGQHQLSDNWRTLVATGLQYSEVALQPARLCYSWLAGHAARLDARLTYSQPAYYLPVKAAAGRAAAAASHYGGIAGERALVLGSQAAKHTYQTAEAGWAVARPYVNATAVAARPYWDVAVARAGPLWAAAVQRGHAVKAGVLEYTARLQAEAGPVVRRWSTAAQQSATSVLRSVQIDGPVYAEMAWNASCRAATTAWGTAHAGWKVVRTETPVYVDAAGKWLSKTVASLTGAK